MLQAQDLREVSRLPQTLMRAAWRRLSAPPPQDDTESQCVRQGHKITQRRGALASDPRIDRFCADPALGFQIPDAHADARTLRKYPGHGGSLIGEVDFVFWPAGAGGLHKNDIETKGLRPRMTEEWNGPGLRVGQRRVGRLMRQNGIRIVRSRKFKRTTDSDHAFNIAPKLLQQDFSASGPNQKWAGDITYVWTREGWVSLAVIIDLYSRRVIGWAISNRMKQDLAIRALNMAVALHRPPPGCIHHTDRGSQYCAHEYQKILRRHGFSVSMSDKGNCHDNSAVERCFKFLRAERVWRRECHPRRDVEIAVFQYINGFYNPRRKHSALGWKSPVAFEQRAA